MVVVYFSALNARCDDLPSISDSSIQYTPPGSAFINLPDGEHYVGTIAVYKCSLGYKLVGGSVRACVPGGMWNGKMPTCGIIIIMMSTHSLETNCRAIYNYTAIGFHGF